MAVAKPVSRSARAVVWLSHGLLAISAFLCALVAWSYFSRADVLAALTVFPIWAWLIPGGLAAGLGCTRESRRYVAIITAAWLVTLIALADRPLALLRLSAPAVKERRNTLRVISLNCNGGNLRAVQELAAYEPDLLLLQESPSRSRLEAAARELFDEEGAVVWGVDASIIARGRLTAQPLPPEAAAHAVWGRLELASGGELDVVSLRLEHGLVRCDLWSPDCWRAQTANRQTRRKQLAAVLAALGDRPARRALVLGGDFNAPAGDAVFRLLAPLAHDTFAEAGRGWGNTIINQFPALRIDQIWIGGPISSTEVHAVRTQHSDHRAVVCDLRIE